ncbi:MAG: hypothetical protein ACE367_01850 [Acidimicrobiales bacterium]
MPDFAKKAAKRVAAVAHDGEITRAALFVRPCTGETAKALGAPGGVLSHVGRLADDVAGELGTDESGPATAFTHNAVLVLTDRRLLVFGHGSLTGRVKGLVADFDLSDIARLHLDTPEGAAATLELTFTDDTTVRLVPGSRRQRFVEAFDEGRVAEA